MTEQEVLRLVRERMGCKSQNVFARELGITGGNLSHILHGKARPSKQLLAALGLVAVVDYRPIVEVEMEALRSAGRLAKRKPVFRYGDWPVGVGR